MLDYILNGQAHGSTASRLLSANLDYGVLRPFIGKGGKSYVAVKERDRKSGKQITVHKMIPNAVATLRKDEWKLIDRAIIEAAQPRLKAWADLRSANAFNIPQGMGKTILESQSMSDISPAMVSMDSNRQSDGDRPHFDLVGLPLPIVHKDFKFSLRQIMVSRNDGTPLDTSMLALAGRKVAEEIEKLTVGTGVGYAYGGYSLYGYTNFPGRLTFEITDPTEVGWTPKTLLTEILEMRQLSMDNGYYGPFRVYIGPKWSLFMDMDYSDDKGDNTLRSRLLVNEGIQSIQTLDYMPDYDIVMVQMTSDVARAVTALDITTMQWEQMGGMEICLRVMAIMVPQLRTDFYGNTGLVHGAVVPAS